MERYSLEINDVVLESSNQSIESSDSYVRLINGVSAKFESGKISAVMGASGSSKTTLMSLIAGHVDPRSRTHGSILLNGKARDVKTWLSKVAYLEQDDYVVPQQTVKEYIYFSVRCRIDRKKLGTRTVNNVVDEAMKKLHIHGLRDTMITAISGGERKRVMIAVEFAVEADVLLLDEATSGLDSHLAFELLHLLKAYAMENNKVVIMIVHQPGSGLFDMFDYLLFLSKGSVIYSGPVSEYDIFLDSKGICRTGNLSKCEFLFELFSSNSSVPEVKIWMDIANKMKTEAYEEGQQRVGDVLLKCSNDPVVDLSLKPHHCLLIVRRQMLHDWRTWGIPKRLIVETGILFLLVPFLGLKLFTIVALEELNMSSSASFNESHKYFMDVVGVGMHGNLAEAVKWGQYPFILFLSAFNASTLLEDTSYIARETSKGTYNAMTLYVSLLLSEYLFVLARCVIFLGILSFMGVAGGLTPMLLVYVFVGSFIAIISSLSIKCITSSKTTKKILSSISSVFTVEGRPMVLTDRIASIRSLGFGYLVHLRYILVFWPHVFFEAFMNIGLVKRILFRADKRYDDKYVKIIRSALQIGYSETEEGYASKYKGFVTGSPSAEISTYWLLFLFLSSLSFVCILSFYALDLRFKPRLRVKLSLME